MAFRRSHALVLLRLAIPVGLAAVGVVLALATRSLESSNRSPFPLSSHPSFRRDFATNLARPTPATPRIDEARVPVQLTIRRGETAASLFGRLGLEREEVAAAASSLSAEVDPRLLRAGDRASAYFAPGARLAALEMDLGGQGRLEMSRGADGWSSRWRRFERTSRLSVARGAIDGAFDSSVQRAGAPVALAYRMADVLQWDVDFSRDLKRGDRFEALYEEILLDGKPHGVGEVVAVAYESGERRHEAFRFGADRAFYDGQGRPLRKMFLRSPLRYSRITSRFSQRRFHPVLGRYRPHYGVDYGAPIGTPVLATASGVVASARWESGGGNVVQIRHPAGYVTAFLHLSKFARGIRAGARIRQGDVIAYTGMTGLASGPHLDYRVKRAGRWIDPLTLAGVRDQELPSRQLASFRGFSQQIRLAWTSGKVDAKGILARDGAPRLAPMNARPSLPSSVVAR